jgi:hypothetical protein
MARNAHRGSVDAGGDRAAGGFARPTDMGGGGAHGAQRSSDPELAKPAPSGRSDTTAPATTDTSGTPGMIAIACLLTGVTRMLWDQQSYPMSRRSLRPQRWWPSAPGGEHSELHGLRNILTLGKAGYRRHPEAVRSRSAGCAGETDMMQVFP